MTRVVFVVIEALPHNLGVSAHTPNRDRLAADGGFNQ